MADLALNVDNEVWLPISGYEGLYSVSNLGRVKSHSRFIKRKKVGRYKTKSRILTNSIDANGYACVGLHKNGVGKKSYVHRLVAEQHLPKPNKNLTQVAHWDGDGSNAKLSNLRWVNQSMNEADKIRHKRNNYTPKGSRRFSEDDVMYLRAEHKKGRSFRALAKEFGCGHGTVSLAIRNGSVPKQ